MDFLKSLSLCSTFAVCLTAAVFSFQNGLYAQTRPGVAQSTGTQKLDSVTDQPSQTLANLMADYTREMNTQEKYAAYAKQADKEGYRKVAELFRAASKSEEIHSALNAKAITELGTKPAAEITTPTVRTTKENLKEAIKTEKDETITIYPVHLVQAKTDGVKTAAVAFGSAIPIGTNRHKYFKEALSKLRSWKNPSNGFFVCSVCGNLVEKPDFAECPVCKAPVSAFVQVK